MGKVYGGIDQHQREWIAEQPLFFVGTAPLDGEGHVNVSPKGPIGTLRVLDDHTVAYLDMVGGAEEIEAYVAKKNSESIDGLPAFDAEGEPAEA